MSPRFLKIFLAAVPAFAFSAGCRAPDAPAPRSVEFVSVPAEATVFVNGKNRGLTPLTLRLSREDSHEVRFSLPGYFDEDFLLAPSAGTAREGERIDVALVKISPETLAARKAASRGNAGAGTPDAAARERSPAAEEFLKRARPTTFADFRLKEDALDRLLRSGAISESEHRELHERLRAAYEEASRGNAPGGKSSAGTPK